MDKSSAIRIIKNTFEKPFDREQYRRFIKELLNRIDESNNFVSAGNRIPNAGAFQPFINSIERVGKYQDADGKKIDCLIVNLKKETSLEYARTSQRNFVARYLQGFMGGDDKDAALVAFVSPDSKDWRFSLVKVDYSLDLGKLKTELTPARRYSFLVGENESSHTAQLQLLPILQEDRRAPLLTDFEEAFSIEIVTKEFFTKYRELYHEVEEALQEVVKKDTRVRDNFQANKVDTVNFAKKLLGQIVFLYFLQKKGWFGVPRKGEWGQGSKSFLRELFEKKHSDYGNFFNDILEPLFYEALRNDRSHDDHYYSRFDCKIPFLNGGLFDPINNYDWIGTEILLPNELFSNKNKTKEGDTGAGILDVFDRYNFTVKEDEPLDKEVAVDPEMLGKVFENLLEVKDRKSKGTYYTPREIVHYMCQESLINYLDTTINSGAVPIAKENPVNLKLLGAPATQQMAMKADGYTGRVPREDIETFVRMGELAVEHDRTAVQNLDKIEQGLQKTTRYQLKLKSIQENAALIDNALANIRVCDPAIGSGAFPVGLMSEIVRARDTLTTYLSDKEGRTKYNFKRHAIQSCLYGVDIDPSAVEIAKLRLWLSLVVDEEDIKKIQPLPNLDYKIVCGNSLRGVERNMFNNELFKKLEELKPMYFNQSIANKKLELRKQIDYIIKKLTNSNETFDFEVYFSEIFHKKGGFDVMIANPPYISHVNYSREDKEALSGRFQTFGGRADLYVAFYEKGIELLRKDGALAYITPNKFLRAGYGAKLRGYLNSQTRLDTIIDFGDTAIFDATTYPCIVLLKKESVPSEYSFRHFHARDTNTITDPNSFQVFQSDCLRSQVWSFGQPSLARLWEKIGNSSTKLSTYINNQFYRGIVTGLNEAFLIDKAQRDDLISKNPLLAEIVKPYLRGKDVKRWRLQGKSYVLFMYHGINIDKYPEVLDYLAPYKDKLEQRATSAKHKWYELQQPQTGIYDYYAKPKIISTDIAKRCEFTIDNSGCFIDATIFCITVPDYYLLALLNSSLIEAYYRSISSIIRGDFLRFKKIYVDTIPIRTTPPSEQKPFIDIVTNILAITAEKDYPNNSAKQSKVREYELCIDQMVYKLYGLTSEEISLIEQSEEVSIVEDAA